MEIAKSIYYGGLLVTANECDYSTSKQLGLICPICSEAVFLKAKNSQKIDPHFAHYKANKNSLDCENRVKTSAGSKAIQKIEREAKQQRLSIYNKYLWALILKDSEFEKSRLLKLRKFIGQKRIKFYAKEFSQEWQKFSQEFYLIMEESVNQNIQRKITYSDPLIKLGHNQQKQYFQNKCDLRLHLLICQEISEYLSTKTAQGIWLKLTILGLALRFSIAYRRKEIEPKIKNQACLRLIAGVLAGIHWVELIYVNKHNFQKLKLED